MEGFSRQNSNIEEEPEVTEKGGSALESPEKEKATFLGELRRKTRALALGLSLLNVASINSGSISREAQKHVFADNEITSTLKSPEQINFETVMEDLDALADKIAEVRNIYGDQVFDKIYHLYRGLPFASIKEGLEMVRGENPGISQEEAVKKVVDTLMTESVGPTEKEVTAETEVREVKGENGVLEVEQLKQILSSLPEGWVTNEIIYIGQKEVEIDKEKAQEKEWSVVARVDRAGPNWDSIWFLEDSSDFSVYYLINTLMHEVAHANDWTSDNEMSFYERLDMLLELTNRYKEDDRYMSTYVEGIEIERDKDNAELYRKVSEYWAEICSQYFEDPSVLHVKDIQIIEKHINRTDPDFDVSQTMKTVSDINSIFWNL